MEDQDGANGKQQPPEPGTPAVNQVVQPPIDATGPNQPLDVPTKHKPMSTYQRWSLGITSVGVIVGIGVLAVYYCQLLQMVSSTQAATVAADAAKASTDIAKKTLEAMDRPWLNQDGATLESFTVRPDGTVGATVRLRWRNVGNSVALNVGQAIEFRWAATNDIASLRKSVCIDADLSAGVVGHPVFPDNTFGENETLGITVADKPYIDPALITMFGAGRWVMPQISSCASYEIAGRRHYTVYVWHITTAAQGGVAAINLDRLSGRLVLKVWPVGSYAD